MGSATKAIWSNGKKTATGCWSYNRSSDLFTIRLDSIDRITGRQRIFTTSNDHPEWGNWKLQKESVAEAI